MRQKGIYNKDARALILGIAFKENFNDIRNSKVPKIYKVLETEGLEVEVFLLVADPESVNKEYGIYLTKAPSKYVAVILAMAHQVFIENGVGKYKNPKGAVLYDIKSTLDREVIDGRLQFF